MKEIYDEAKKVALKLDLKMYETEEKCATLMENFLGIKTKEKEEFTLEFCSKNIGRKVVAEITEEFNARFKLNSFVFKGLNSLNPKHKNFLDFESLKNFAKHYKIEELELKNELNILKPTIKRELENGLKLDSLLDLVIYLDDVGAFPHMFKAAKIAITLPVSTSTAERTFSILKRILNEIRNRCGDSRLSCLAFIVFHKEIIKKLQVEVLRNIYKERYPESRITL